MQLTQVRIHLSVYWQLTPSKNTPREIWAAYSSKNTSREYVQLTQVRIHLGEYGQLT